jgi:hypothetical protein
MIPSTRYLIGLALTATMGVALCCLSISLATAEGAGISVPISAATRIQHLTKTDMETIFFVQESVVKEPLLRMVQIRTTSSRGLKQLRAMHLGIVRVGPDPARPPGKEMLSGGFIVEAVVSSGMLKKLKAKGFEVTEIP